LLTSKERLKLFQFIGFRKIPYCFNFEEFFQKKKRNFADVDNLDKLREWV
jgi:hypothetical protein